MSQDLRDTQVLTAKHVLEYPYRRSVGPVLGQFFGALEESRIEGSRTSTGRVLVPPSEYDPDTGDPIVDMVEVGPTGAVVSWSWVNEPRAKHPLDRPFAWALVKLDGADTPMLHAVDAGSENAMSLGMRVVPRWRDERTGHITDLVCFVPEGKS